MLTRHAVVLALVTALFSGAGLPGITGFQWSTFFYEDIFGPQGEAIFELISVFECAGLGAWFGGVGGAIGGLACGVAGWA